MHPKHLRSKADVYNRDMGLSIRQVALRLCVSKSTAHRWVFGQGIILPRKKRTDCDKVFHSHVASMTIANPFMSCSEIRNKLYSEHDINVSISTVYRHRKRSLFSFKRASRSHQHEFPNSDHPFMLEDNVYDGAIAIDESCFVSSDRPMYGWAPIGHLVSKAAPRKRKTISQLLAIDAKGSISLTYRKGAYNGVLFAEFLKSLPCDRRIILDNVAFHKSKVVRETAAQRNQVLTFTPPYCPWFNPVEHAFSVAKHDFRKRRFETPDQDFLQTVRDSFQSITPAKCEGFFQGAMKKWNAQK